MTDKFTDQEIIKAFEDTINTLSKRDCLIVPKDGIENLCFGLTSVLDLINHQQADNQNLKGHLEQLKSRYDNAKAEIENARISVKSYKGKYESAVKAAKEYQSVIKEKDAEIERLNKEVEALNYIIMQPYHEEKDKCEKCEKKLELK